MVENNRPGVTQRFSLGYEQLVSEHPRLMCCSMSAYGQMERASEGRFDLTIQAASGVMSVTGEEGRASQVWVCQYQSSPPAPTRRICDRGRPRESRYAQRSHGRWLIA